jgi:hypothetical protein
MLGPLEVLRETRALLQNLEARSELRSDHYTNYINLQGRMPRDRQRLLAVLDEALARDEASFRPVFIGTV